jgi:hypothetical protein
VTVGDRVGGGETGRRWAEKYKRGRERERERSGTTMSGGDKLGGRRLVSGRRWLYVVGAAMGGGFWVGNLGGNFETFGESFLKNL